MVYIHLNQKIQSYLPKYLPKSIALLIFQDKKYLSYKEFKLLQKKLKLQLHKYIHRKDIILQAQIDHKIELSRRSQLERKVIQQLKDREAYNKSNPSLADQISFLWNEVRYHDTNDKLSDQIYSAAKMIFGICMGLFLGYVVAQSGFGLEPLWSVCVGAFAGGGIFFWNQNVIRNKKIAKQKSEEKEKKKTARNKDSIASIEFGHGTDNNSSTINFKGKLKKGRKHQIQ